MKPSKRLAVPRKLLSDALAALEAEGHSPIPGDNCCRCDVAGRLALALGKKPREELPDDIVSIEGSLGGKRVRIDLKKPKEEKL